MKRASLFFVALLLMLAMTVVFTSCGNNEEPADDPPQVEDATPTPEPQEVEPDPYDDDEYNGDDDDTPPVVDARQHPALDRLDVLFERYPMFLTNNNPILERGHPANTIRLANASNATFPGLFEGVMSAEAMDGQIMDFQRSPFVTTDASWMFTDDGIAILRFDPANNAVELNMQHDVYWHDGTPLTLDDLVFAYELMSHPEEEAGIRFTETHFVPWVIGIDEWISGEADHIAGLVLSNNNRTLRIYYDRPLPPSAQYAGGIWLTPTPRHHLTPAIEEVGWGELYQHPRARHEALGWGPWIIDTIVPGEAVIFRANENYHRGAPNIDYIHWQIVPTAIYMAAMRAGEFDIVINGISATDYEEHLLYNPNNVSIIGQPGTGAGFLYFRTGTFDEVVIPREEGWHPIQNLAIRRALSHSMPLQQVADAFMSGLSVQAGTIMSPHNARMFIDPDVPGFYFDMDKANAILDEAGFTERGDDGFRLDLDGSPMYFNFALNDNPTNQLAVHVYLQHWRDIGLDVRLYTGDLLEWNTFLDNLLMSDNWSDNVHMFISNWSLGANPAPHGLWARDAAFNLARHMTDEMYGILADIVSQDAFNDDFLMDAYQRWQSYMYRNAVANPMFWGVGLTMVNHRVANYSVERISGFNGQMQRTHLWGLTADTPYVNTN